MLHAASLSFPHPAGGTTRIEAPIPTDMLAVLRAVGLEASGTKAAANGLP
jgi:tRNA pseudouridine32 synthase/23S rRNA pseudouridine746 synthase